MAVVKSEFQVRFVSVFCLWLSLSRVSLTARTLATEATARDQPPGMSHLLCEVSRGLYAAAQAGMQCPATPSRSRFPAVSASLADLEIGG